MPQNYHFIHRGPQTHAMEGGIPLVSPYMQVPLLLSTEIFPPCLNFQGNPGYFVELEYWITNKLEQINMRATEK